MSDKKTVPDDVTLFRAAVQGVRKCLELSNENTKHIDLLCNGFLDFVNGSNPKLKLKRFCDSARPHADGDLYLTAILQAFDNAKSEEEAEFLVLQSVNAQLLARASDRTRTSSA